MKKEKEIILQSDIGQRIFIIRGHKVILDSHLAELYGVTAKRLNEQIKRNRDRFPDDFMFQLTKKEKEEVVTICDSLHKLKFSHYLPYAFTEHGIAMLSAVLRSDRAVAMSIFIVRAFIKLREALATNKELAHKVAVLEHTQEEHGEKIESIHQAVVQLIGARGEPKEHLGFKDKESID